MLVDGVPVPDIQHEWLHSQVSIVSQEPILFAESIMYNITFGVQDPEAVSLAQVRHLSLLCSPDRRSCNASFLVMLSVIC